MLSKPKKQAAVSACWHRATHIATSVCNLPRKHRKGHTSIQTQVGASLHSMALSQVRDRLQFCSFPQ